MAYVSMRAHVAHATGLLVIRFTMKCQLERIIQYNCFSHRNTGCQFSDVSYFVFVS